MEKLTTVLIIGMDVGYVDRYLTSQEGFECSGNENTGCIRPALL